jgi:BirA family biotin operon repressor/biotin-[acetyl-CoA-carboxylase] ligase
VTERLQAVDSTQRVARERAAAGVPSGYAVVAESQSAGRGRLDRTWVSPPGGDLYLSMVLRPPLPARSAPLLALHAAAALAEALGVQVKWPNDLVAGSRKLGGILAEMEAEGDRVRWIVLGLGLNVNRRDFPPSLPGATSLALVGDTEQDREAVLARVLSALRPLGTLATFPSLDAWRARSATLGTRVRVGEVEGVATAVRDEDGALCVGGCWVVAGEIGYVGAPGR